MLKRNVLRYQKDFDSIYRKGKSVGDRYVVIFSKRNGLSYTRTAFLASKKVGNSVKRNRARRLMKEAMRLSQIKLPEGYDFVIIARNTISDANCRNVQRSLESAFKRTGVVMK
jgi:ribonuclease P protein component